MQDGLNARIRQTADQDPEHPKRRKEKEDTISHWAPNCSLSKQQESSGCLCPEHTDVPPADVNRGDPPSLCSGRFKELEEAKKEEHLKAKPGRGSLPNYSFELKPV